MGEQPIVIDGKASRCDVSPKPDLRNKLWGAKHRADDLEGYMSTLHNWAAGGAYPKYSDCSATRSDS